MADDAVRELLAKLSLDLGGWEASVKRAKETLASALSDDRARTQEAATAQAAAISGIERQTVAHEKLRTASAGAAAAEKTRSEAATRASTKEATSHRETARAIAESARARVSAAESGTRAAEISSKTQHEILSEHKKVTDQIVADLKRRKRAEEEAAASGERGGGGLFGFLAGRPAIGKAAEEHRSLASMFAPSAVVAAGGEETILGGALADFLGGPLGMAAAGGAAFGAVTEGITTLTEKMKEFIEDSGGLQKVLYTFQELSQGTYGDNGVEFLEKMEKATSNLVSETDLLRAANTMMESGLGVSRNQILQLLQATVGLARGQGKGATEAVDALMRVYLTQGRGSYRLAQELGIVIPRNISSGLGPLATEKDRSMMQFQYLQKEILSRYASPDRLGEPPITYTDRIQQVKVQTQEIFENFAQGVISAGGFKAFMDMIGRVVESMTKMVPVAERVGEAFGNLFGIFAASNKISVEIWHILVQLFSDLKAALSDVTSSFTHLAEALDTQHGQFAKLHPILSLTIDLMTALGTVIANDINGLDLLVSVLDKAYGQLLLFIHPQTAIANIGEMFSSKEFQKYQDRNQGLSFFKNFGTFYDQYQKAHPEHHSDKSYAELYETYQRNAREIPRKMSKARREIMETFSASSTVPHGASGSFPDFDPAVARREAMMQAQSTMQEQQKMAQLALQKAKADIEVETEAEEQRYKTGIEGARAYYAAKEALAKKTLDATLTDIAKEQKAQEDYLAFQLSIKQIDLKTYVHKLSANTATYGIKAQEAQTAYSKENNADQIALLEMRNKAIADSIDGELSRKKAALEAETEAVKSAYDEQTISTNDYYSFSLQSISKDAQMTAEAEATKQNRTHLRDTALEASINKQISAYGNALKRLQALDDEMGQKALHEVQARFQNYGGSLGTARGVFENEGGQLSMPSTQLDMMKEQSSVLETQFNTLHELLDTQKQYSATWFQIYNAMLQVTQQAQQLNEQMQRLSDYSLTASGFLSEFEKSTQGVMTSRYGRGLESAISGAAQSLQTTHSVIQQIFGKGTKEVDPMAKIVSATQQATASLAAQAKASISNVSEESSKIKSAMDFFTEALNALAARLQAVLNELSGGKNASSNTTQTSAGIISSGGPAVAAAAAALASNIGKSNAVKNVIPPTAQDTGLSLDQSNLPKMTSGVPDLGTPAMPAVTSAAASASEKLQDFAKKLTLSISAIGGFIGSISGASSASAGAFGGGISGAGLGQGVGSSLGQQGGPLQGMGSFAGPFGAILGASLGAALGGIMGNKQEMVQEDINQLNYTYKTIMQDYSSNNASLAATIQNLQNLIAQAEADQSSSKKGGQQFAQLILQYNEQIQQLESQAEQTMAQLQQQLDVITAPYPFQNLLSNIQQVIQQYAQFASAAQNATQLGQANQFLVSSLQNIGTQYTDQLRQSEEDAIQNALNLTQLYTQRNQLQLQFLQSTEQIEGQGTLTRQLTLSQTKFSQLYALDVNHQNQLMELDQQISTAQYKLAAEQQIFNLAQDKAGLEQQMLVLQEQGINQDMGRIQAMHSLLSTLQSTGYSITNLGSIDVSNPNALQTLLLNLLTSMLGSNGAFAGITEPNGQNTFLDTLVSGTYANRAAYGYGNFRGTNL